MVIYIYVDQIYYHGYICRLSGINSFSSYPNTNNDYLKCFLNIGQYFTVIILFVSNIYLSSENNWITLTDWTRLENSVQSVSWKSFHHNHKDFLKASVRARNGALNDRIVETNGVLIDLTAPVMDWLNDGNIAASDIDFQVINSIFLLYFLNLCLTFTDHNNGFMFAT